MFQLLDQFLANLELRIHLGKINDVKTSDYSKTFFLRITPIRTCTLIVLFEIILSHFEINLQIQLRNSETIQMKDEVKDLFPLLGYLPRAIKGR